MNYFLDINYSSINKYGEELCGDKVEIVHNENGYIAVLSDGLGSGVKANILSTLTSKIVATMIKDGASIEETIETIINTLPECKIRKLAYSTFTIIKIDNEYNTYIAEYDNPAYFYYNDGVFKNIPKTMITVGNKNVFESKFKLQLGDSLNIISDGAVHAGIGQLLNLGWGWSEINDYLEGLNKINNTSKILNGNFIGVCNNLYNNKPGDDTTILTIKLRKPEYIDIFIGPPVDKSLDKELAKLMTKGNSKKILCGGTTALIAQRELNRELNVDIDTMREGIPPIAYIDGFDLVTEGVLTLGKTLEMIKEFNKNTYDNYIDDKDYNGCSLLTKMLIQESTHINFYIGKAVNPAHQNPNFPTGFNIKLKIIYDLIEELKKAGKEITTKYL
ncbi:SpoIIE family protein phosphatase [Sedimentibacter sp. zth1]|uniref:SpoIIE family protein phosphatase n=1 Tax=Sedimentibacter sp. zth1 TaxID=2816908 RepID=UPI001A92B2C1|nr:SpoIIE family protein phosphatase [Sedimentibacter sp. zth1]QSX05820.1 SpoIIE family protein phosphatase [Sedimentibacter sp. zth1]